jgi:hypothetical protein
VDAVEGLAKIPWWKIVRPSILEITQMEANAELGPDTRYDTHAPEVLYYAVNVAGRVLVRNVGGRTARSVHLSPYVRSKAGAGSMMRDDKLTKTLAPGEGAWFEFEASDGILEHEKPRSFVVALWATALNGASVCGDLLVSPIEGKRHTALQARPMGTKRVSAFATSAIRLKLAMWRRKPWYEVPSGGFSKEGPNLKSPHKELVQALRMRPDFDRAVKRRRLKK